MCLPFCLLCCFRACALCSFFFSCHFHFRPRFNDRFSCEKIISSFCVLTFQLFSFFINMNAFIQHKMLFFSFRLGNNLTFVFSSCFRCFFFRSLFSLVHVCVYGMDLLVHSKCKRSGKSLDIDPEAQVIFRLSHLALNYHLMS